MRGRWVFHIEDHILNSRFVYHSILFMKSDMSIVYPNEERFVMHKHHYQKSGDLSLVKKCEGFMYIWIGGLERFLENILENPCIYCEDEGTGPS